MKCDRVGTEVKIIIRGGITETIHVLREGRKIGINRFGSERNNECCC
jgi:hypothetical protein